MAVVALLVLAFEVIQIGAAGVAAEGVEMEVDILAPLFVQGPQQAGADGAALGATETLRLPHFRQQVFKFRGLRIQR